MSEQVIAAVLIHVDNTKAALEWYEKAFPEAKRCLDSDFEYLDYQGVALELVPADNKVRSGAAGSVVYWWADDFQQRLEYLLSLGATLYRGPMDIGGGLKMCQVKDLWGNCIGIKGS